MSMKILVLSGCQPHSLGAREAANTVSYHIVNELAASMLESFICVSIPRKFLADVALAKRYLIDLGVDSFLIW